MCDAPCKCDCELRQMRNCDMEDCELGSCESQDATTNTSPSQEKTERVSKAATGEWRANMKKLQVPAVKSII
jgi:hypothetical protein